MEWRDQGILLSLRRHGESAAIIETFTAAHGRHAGLVRGGGGRRMAPALQPGTQLDLVWRARLEDHLGTFLAEPLRARAGALMNDRLALAGLSAACGLMAAALPEREPLPRFYLRSVQLLDLMAATPAWPLAYLQWEVALLAELGTPLVLDRCAVTGATEGLVHVSPRTGRAVTAAGAGRHAGRLLPLPPCLIGAGEASNAEIAQALGTTGHFLARALPAATAGLPPVRTRLVDLLARAPEP